MNPIPTNPLHPCPRPRAGACAKRWIMAGTAIAALAACGGGGGGGGGGGTTPPPPPPPVTGPSAASSFYLSGGAGGNGGQNLALTGVEPISGGTVIIPDSTVYVASLATIAEWTATNGSATSAGTRYRVWSGSDGKIYNTDLGIVSGTTAPVTTQLSTYPASSICGGVSPTVLNDLAKPWNSAVVFRQESAGQGCGEASDRFVTIGLSATASTAPPVASVNEPVAVARDATGAITMVLFLIHSSPAAVGYASSFSASPTVLTQITGPGINLPTGDFTSLAVVPQSDGSQVWVYRDLDEIFAVNLTALGTPKLVYTAADSDVIQLPVVVQGTSVYLTMNDATYNVGTQQNPLYTCQIVAIGTAAGATSNNTGGLVIQENTAGSGLSLIGLLGTNIVYINNNVVATTSGGNTTYAGSANLEYVPTSYGGQPGTGTPIDAATYPAVFDTTSPPIIVGNGLYYAKDNSGFGNITGYQAYYYAGGAPTLVGPYGSVLVGGASASPVSTGNPSAPAFSSAIIAVEAQGGNFSAGQIYSYDGSGNPSALIGTLPQLQNDNYAGFALSEAPLQAGMPALLVVSGQHNGYAVQDLIEITPGKAGSLHAVTNNLQ